MKHNCTKKSQEDNAESEVPSCDLNIQLLQVNSIPPSLSKLLSDFSQFFVEKIGCDKGKRRDIMKFLIGLLYTGKAEKIKGFFLKHN
jgi:hypothetical protein